MLSMLSMLKYGARTYAHKPVCTPAFITRIATIGTTKYPTVSDSGDSGDGGDSGDSGDGDASESMKIPKEYFTIYDIEKTWNINQPDIHKITLDFLEIVRLENLSVINAFYEVYIKNYEKFIRTHVLSSKKDGMIYDPGWGYCTFVDNYREQQMNFVFVSYIYGRCSDNDINYPNNIHLHYPMIKIRKEIIEWFRPRITGKIWSSLVRSLSQSKTHTQLYAIMRGG